MIVFTNAEYRVPAGIEPYKENTRETFRRQAIHQFEQARVVDRNLDSDDLATNSPNTQYALSSSARAAIRSYGTKQFAAEAAALRESHGSLLAVYTASKRMHLARTAWSACTTSASPASRALLRRLCRSSWSWRRHGIASLLVCRLPGLQRGSRDDEGPRSDGPTID